MMLPKVPRRHPMGGVKYTWGVEIGGFSPTYCCVAECRLCITDKNSYNRKMIGIDWAASKEVAGSEHTTRIVAAVYTQHMHCVDMLAC